jgi:hypothetical protein
VIKAYQCLPVPCQKNCAIIRHHHRDHDGSKRPTHQTVIPAGFGMVLSSKAKGTLAKNAIAKRTIDKVNPAFAAS